MRTWGQWICLASSYLAIEAFGASTVRQLRNGNGIAILDPRPDFKQWSLDAAQVVESSDAAFAKSPELMAAINQFRAKICYNMKNAHGNKFESFHKCRDFMEKACKPGKDQKMDGDDHERPSGHGYCKLYFPENEEEAKKTEEESQKHQEELDKMEAEEEVVEDEVDKEISEDEAGKDGEAGKKEEAKGEEKGAAAGAEAKGKDAAKGAEAEGDKKASEGEEGKKDGKEGDAKAADKDDGKPKLPDSEAWYYKKGGKDAGRFHMNEKLKLPTQGYWGPLVAHKDMKTSTGDWRSEFGDSDGKTLAEVCKDHPTSHWCSENGHASFVPTGPKSTAPLTFGVTSMLLIFVVGASFM